MYLEAPGAYPEAPGTGLVELEGTGLEESTDITGGLRGKVCCGAGARSSVVQLQGEVRCRCKV